MSAPTDLPAGDLPLGPAVGWLRLRTYREGVAARAGHDLLLEAAEWRGSLRVPERPGTVVGVEVEVEVDLRRLEVLEGTGGVKPLSESDKADIRKAMRKPLRTDDHPIATFRSSTVTLDGERATVVGELSLAGQTHPVELHVGLGADRTIHGTAQVVQTAWGVKPYTGLLGALRLRDAVDVEFEVRLPD